MMEERKENDFKMDTEDLRLLNAFGEALGDLPSEEETRAAWNAFTSRQDAQKRRRIIQMWTSGIAAAIVGMLVLIVPAAVQSVNCTVVIARHKNLGYFTA